MLPAASLALLGLLFPALLRAQDGQETSPSGALRSALVAACRQDETQFAHYLTAENVEAFHALPPEQRKTLMQRLLLIDAVGRPMLSSDEHDHTVLRCETQSDLMELRFEAERVHDNLAFIPVQVMQRRRAEFGLVREDRGWRLLSLGLLLFNIPELEKRWAEEDLEAHEVAVIKTVRALAEVIGTYRRTWGKLPDSLAQLGPPAKEGVSAEAADLVDEDLADGSRHGYKYGYRVLASPDGGEPGFELTAMPETYGKVGRRSFLLDAAGKLHGGDHQGDVASGKDPVVPSGDDH